MHIAERLSDGAVEGLKSMNSLLDAEVERFQFFSTKHVTGPVLLLRIEVFFLNHSSRKLLETK